MAPKKVMKKTTAVKVMKRKTKDDDMEVVPEQEECVRSQRLKIQSQIEELNAQLPANSETPTISYHKSRQLYKL